MPQIQNLGWLFETRGPSFHLSHPICLSVMASRKDQVMLSSGLKYRPDVIQKIHVRGPRGPFQSGKQPLQITSGAAPTRRQTADKGDSFLKEPRIQSHRGKCKQ